MPKGRTSWLSWPNVKTETNGMKSHLTWRPMRAGASASLKLPSSRLTAVNQGLPHRFRHSDLHQWSLKPDLTQALIRQLGWAETAQFMIGRRLRYAFSASRRSRKLKSALCTHRPNWIPQALPLPLGSGTRALCAPLRADPQTISETLGIAAPKVAMRRRTSLWVLQGHRPCFKLRIQMSGGFYITTIFSSQSSNSGTVPP